MAEGPDRPTDPDHVGAAEERGDAAVTSDRRTPGYRRDEVDAVGIPYHPVWSTFALMLHGPVLWAIHFLVVYLATEWACAQGGGSDAAVTATTWSTVLFAVAVVVGSAITAVQWRGAAEDADEFAPDSTETTDVDPLVRDRVMLGVGLMLGVLALVAVLAVGVTATVVPPC